MERRFLQPVQGGPGFFSIGGHGQQDGVAPLLHNGAVQLGDLVGLVALQHSLLVGYPGLQPIQGGRCRVLIGEHQHCNLLRPAGKGGVDGAAGDGVSINSVQGGGGVLVYGVQGIAERAGVQQGLGGRLRVIGGLAHRPAASAGGEGQAQQGRRHQADQQGFHVSFAPSAAVWPAA